jgi:glycolate oxidase iron-sulfur subunit
MNACAKCGACSVVCPVYRVTGREAHTARGKIHLTQVPELTGQGTVYEDIFSKCLLCGACAAVCPRDIDVRREVVAARAAFPVIYGEHGYEKYLARKALAHPETLAALRVLGRLGADMAARYLPAKSGLRLRLALFRQDLGEPVSPVPVSTKGQPASRGSQETLTYFPGCTGRYLFPTIATACHSLLADRGYDLQVPAGLSCCGLAALSAGDRPEARRCARNNIAALALSSGPILVSCASCYAHLSQYPELFADDEPWRHKAEAMQARLVELSCFLDSHPSPVSARPGAGPPKIRVYYHDPCHFRYGLQGQKIIIEPRRVLGRHPDLELLELPGGAECCGQGGLFHISAPEIAAVIGDTLAVKVLALAPDVITSTCSGCLMQWRLAVERADSRVPVLHLAELLATVAE